MGGAFLQALASSTGTGLVAGSRRSGQAQALAPGRSSALLLSLAMARLLRWALALGLWWAQSLRSGVVVGWALVSSGVLDRGRHSPDTR